jgi:hypothetical protein
MDFREIGFGDTGWIIVVKDRDQWKALVSMAVNLRVP